MLNAQIRLGNDSTQKHMHQYHGILFDFTTATFQIFLLSYHFDWWKSGSAQQENRPGSNKKYDIINSDHAVVKYVVELLMSKLQWRSVAHPKSFKQGTPYIQSI